MVNFRYLRTSLLVGLLEAGIVTYATSIRETDGTCGECFQRVPTNYELDIDGKSITYGSFAFSLGTFFMYLNKRKDEGEVHSHDNEKHDCCEKH